jgi:hypothetical protein
MSNVMHRQINAQLPEAVKGDGVYIVDRDGKRYLDASGGAAVSCLGHSDADVIAAIKSQVDQLAYAHSGFFTTAVMEELADFIVDRAPGGLGHVYFVSGGSEAAEAAMKLARQYYLEIGQPERHRFIARRQSYHGNTLGALSVGGNMWRRQPYDPILMPSSHISPCYAYRGRAAGETDETYGERVADELEAMIIDLGPETVCGFLAEPVVGATLGAVPPVPGYFKRVREICDRHGVLLILDEVMCGMGRTGSLFACDQDGIVPDILFTAKGLGAGYQPIGAMLMSGQVFDALAKGSGAFLHGHTYMGHATASAAALAVQRKIEQAGLLDNVVARGRDLEAALIERFGNHPHVGNIRGRGLFWGVELVADRADKTPFDPADKLNGRIKKLAMAAGLMCYPGGGTLDGRRGDHVLLAPPYIISTEQISEIVDKLGTAVDGALAEIKS